MRERALADVVRLFGEAGIPAAAVRSYAEAARSPHVEAREMLQWVVGEASEPDGIPVTGPAAKFSRTPIRVRSAAPELGAHNDEILAELGIDAERRRELRSAGVI
jgi:formyl-CoA transferase